MTSELKKFMEIISKEKDEARVNEINSMSKEDAINATIAWAGEFDIKLTEEDFKNAGGELDDDALDNASGGVYAPHVLGIIFT